jgi:LacI family transcriptional regulator
MAEAAKPLRHVALGYPVAVPWVALFMRGVVDYADRHGGWLVTTSPPTLGGTDEFAINVYTLQGWPGDGVITSIHSDTEAEAAAQLGIPVVNISGALEHSPVPRVMVDHYSIGRLAAEHLLERGFRRLAYCGTKGLFYSKQRMIGFMRCAEKAGVQCDVYETPRSTNQRAPWQHRAGPLNEWLRHLRPPLGLMAMQDYRARVVIDECRHLGLDVPHDVAVIGVDNDPTICEFCQPTLSSVSRNAWRMGYDAAATLDLLMDGRKPVNPDAVIIPEGIVARQSTDTVAVDDPHVADAVHFMRDHLGEPFGIKQVMQNISVSRRQLELRFRRALQCTPHEYLCRLRVDHAKDLLANRADLKIRSIATACGFSSEERMRLVFRRLTGTSPLDYRRQARARAAGRPE